MGRANVFLKGNQLQIIEKVTATAGANKTSGLIAGATVSTTTISNPATLGSGIEMFTGASEGILGVFRTSLAGVAKAELGYMGSTGDYGIWGTIGGFGGTAFASRTVDIVAGGLDVIAAGGLVITGTGTVTFGSNTLSATVATLETPILNTSVSGTAFLDEDTLVSDSATKLASQQSIKAYADALSYEVSDLTDITLTSIGANEMLQWDGAAWINQTITEIGFLQNIVEDITPQLGANLDVSTFNFVSTSNNPITLAPLGTGKVIITKTGIAQDMQLDIIGGTAKEAIIFMSAADGAANDDDWQVVNEGSGVLTIESYSTGSFVAIATFTSATSVTFAEGLILSTGKDLTLTSGSVVSLSNADIAIAPHGTGDAIIGANNATGLVKVYMGTTLITLPSADGAANEVMETDGSGTISWVAPSAVVATVSAITNVTITSNTSGELLQWNGSAWINQTLTEIGIVLDTSPQLGGNLDINGSVINIDGAGGITINSGGTIISDATVDITISPGTTGDLILGANNSSGLFKVYFGTTLMTFPTGDGTANQVLKTDAAGTLSWVTPSGGTGISNVVDDTTPQLGGDLDTQGNEITTASGNDLLLSVGSSSDEVHILKSNGDIHGKWDNTHYVSYHDMQIIKSVSLDSDYPGTALNAVLSLVGGEGKDAEINLTADDDDDNSDSWQIKSPASGNKFTVGVWTGSAYTARFTITPAGAVALASGVGVNEFSNDGTMAGNSDLAVPTEKAVVTYTTATFASKSHAHSAVDITSGTLTTARGGTGLSSTVTSTEFGYLAGVTSAIQTQLNAKASTSHTHSVNVVGDTTPQLGGDLDTQGNEITTASGNDLLLSVGSSSDEVHILKSNGDIHGKWDNTHYVSYHDMQIIKSVSLDSDYPGTALNAVLSLVGGEGKDAEINLTADDDDDNSDSWQIKSPASGNKFTVGVWTGSAYTARFTITPAGAVALASGDFSIQSGKKFYLDGDGGNDYIWLTAGRIEFYVAGVLEGYIDTNGFVST